MRETGDTLLEIAQSCGYSSNEAFSRAFREQFGVNPSQYRRDPRPVVLRTMLRPFDCYLLGIGGTGMENAPGDVKVYYVTIPAHKFLHIRNFESNGYWDFWQRQSRIPGQDCETICGLLDSIPGKLDDQGDSLENSGSGQVMAFWNHPQGRTGSWGIPQAECYGVRLPQDYSGPMPEQMLLLDIPEGEYAVFEHGPFHYETQGAAVEDALQQAMTRKDYAGEGYALDETPGRIAYFYHDCSRQTKYVRPVRPLE